MMPVLARVDLTARAAAVSRGDVDRMSRVRAMPTPMAPPRRRCGPATRCGNANEGGVFAPIVRIARDAIGVKRFNQIRGKAISLHSQVIGDFCEEFGVDSKAKQTLIRTAKKNGGLLGFLA